MINLKKLTQAVETHACNCILAHFPDSALNNLIHKSGLDTILGITSVQECRNLNDPYAMNVLNFCAYEGLKQDRAVNPIFQSLVDVVAEGNPFERYLGV